MASIKVKFRPSTIVGKEGVIYYQIIQSRVPRQLKTDYRIFTKEWDKDTGLIINPIDSRSNYLTSISKHIKRDIKSLESIIGQLENNHIKYSTEDIISYFQAQKTEQSLFNFMSGIITQLKRMGKLRTSETYQVTLSSFMQFREDKDIFLDEIDSDLMLMYEAYLRNKGVTKNSSSFYMRNLRSVYTRAVEKELTQQQFPFKHVYTGVDKTVKRAVPLKIINKIKEMDLSHNPSADFGRDMFLFSFYTRGMSLVDMAYLRKKDLANGSLSYRRRKTGQQLFIKWEKPMQKILDKYNTKNSVYLLPIINPLLNIEERRQYIYFGHKVNRILKLISKRLGLITPLTMYSARHSWASIAKSKNIPISVISEGLGHDSEATTRIYLASLDNLAIDKANRLILKSL